LRLAAYQFGNRPVVQALAIQSLLNYEIRNATKDKTYYTSHVRARRAN
jgi:alkyl hydroperoxide reductase subunit AhpF